MRIRAVILSLLAITMLAATAVPLVAVPFDEPEVTDDPWAGFDDARDDADRTDAVRGYAAEGAQVEVPAFTHRGSGGLAVLDPVPDEAWFRYYLRLDQWDASSSGKLPGFAGLYGSSGRGCIPSVEGNAGWSARTLFEATGTEGAGEDKVRLGTYLYHLDQEDACGDFILWDPGVIEQDRWYCMEGRVAMNTPGSNDGRVDAWIDGTQVLSWPGVGFRREGEEIGVRQFWMNVYFGGSVVNSSDLETSIDDLKVSTEGRLGCLDPFTDDNQSVHEGELEELYARSILLGCDDQLACPGANLTRAQMAAFLRRALNLPEGPDAFADDDGTWAEADINALAAAGITSGCGGGDFCPSESVTRAQMAAFLRRAFGLPLGEDVFSDDDGTWAEVDINALAAAGITVGCTATDFCPEDLVTRAQMASFLRRALGIPAGGGTPLSGGVEDVIGEQVPGSFEDFEEPLPNLD